MIIEGTPVSFDWGYFPTEGDAFSPDLVAEICAAANLPGILGNKHASGTEVIAEFGEEHMRTGKPICYTSSDSVFQIAAHEWTFGLERLLDLCQTVRGILDPLNIGRVIARPFLGRDRATFERTGWIGAFNRYRALAFDPAASADIVGATVDQPSCFIGGALDPVRAMLPGTDLYTDPGVSCTDFRGKTIVDDAGHWVHQEAPDRVNAALDAFLATL